jgi:hypothetical protein
MSFLVILGLLCTAESTNLNGKFRFTLVPGYESIIAPGVFAFPAFERKYTGILTHTRVKTWASAPERLILGASLRTTTGIR